MSGRRDITILLKTNQDYVHVGIYPRSFLDKYTREHNLAIKASIIWTFNQYSSESKE